MRSRLDWSRNDARTLRRLVFSLALLVAASPFPSRAAAPGAAATPAACEARHMHLSPSGSGCVKTAMVVHEWNPPVVISYGSGDPVAEDFKFTLDSSEDAKDLHRVFAHIQSDLDRVAAGQEAWPAPSGAPADPLNRIVDAYADYLHGDIKGMDRELAGIQKSARKARACCMDNQFKLRPHEWEKDNKDFDARLTAASHDDSPLVRLYAGLRAVDGALFYQGFGYPYKGTLDDGKPVTASNVNGMWLRLPCRTVIGRVTQFLAAANTLKTLGGPVLDCPVDGPVDFARDARLAMHPARFVAHVPPPSPPRQQGNPYEAAYQPTRRDLALSEMAKDPAKAKPILEHYAHVDARGELDYALFLHAFEPETPARDAEIRHLVNELAKQAKAAPNSVDDFPPGRYDGTDDSLLNIIRFASESDITNGGYAIPCPILTARPKLSAAIGAYYYSNRDSFMPVSGCPSVNQGGVAHFPAQAVQAYEELARDADGHFIENDQGSDSNGMAAQQNGNNNAMMMNPRAYIEAIQDYDPMGTPPEYRSGNLAYAYQVWGYLGLNNYRTSLRLKKLYFRAYDLLAAYFRHKGLDAKDSQLAARLALFAAGLGSDCGGNLPESSVRRMLLEKAPAGKIENQLETHPKLDPQIAACAVYGGLDPLLLVAVADPAAIPVILAHQGNVDARNNIAKTALMVAAQFDKPGVARLLIARGATVNATTWQLASPDTPPLHDDARTALMYAAANGSLGLIRELLEAGADPYQSDTAGHRAIDYLLGFGPTPPNPKLDKRERAQAARWLF